MSLQNYSQEEITKMSLVELAKLIMLEERKPMKFNDLYDKVSSLKGLTEDEKQARIGQFYTDLNADGTFTSNGSNTWGLKRWYSTNSKQEIDEAQETTQKLVRRKKKAIVEDDDEDDDLDLDLLDDNLDDFEDDFDYDDDFDLDIDEDFEELVEEEN